MVSLQDLCIFTVSGYLTPSNVWSIHRLVPYVHCPRIEHIVHSFICDNFMDISHTDQFLALDEKEIQWLVDNQDIKVSEAAMLDSLARWYKHSERQRENVFKKLLDKVQLSVIKRTVLSELIKRYHLGKVIPELRKYKKVFSQRVDLDDLIHQENMCNISLLCISRKRISSNNTAPNVHMFNYLSVQQEKIKYWMPYMSEDIDIELKKLGKDIFHSYVITCKEKLYIFGLIMEEKADGDSVVKKISVCFDIHSRQFTHCSDPPESLPRGGLHVTCGAYVFIIGGNKYLHLKEQLQSVYRYDTLKDEWQVMPSSIHGHARLSFVSLGMLSTGTFAEIALCFKSRYIFVFGRYCEKFDLWTNTWTEVPSPNIYTSPINALPNVSPLSWDWGMFYNSGYITGEDICMFINTLDQRVLRCLAYNVKDGSWKEPFGSYPSCTFTEPFLTKILGVSKVVLKEAANYKGRIKYKISELRSSEESQQRKLMPCNEKSFLCTPGFIAFGVSIISRGICTKIKECCNE